MWRSGSGRYCGPATADSKGGGPKQAGNDIDDVEDESEGDRFLGGYPERDEEKHERAFSYAQASDTDRQNLKDQDGGVEGEKGRESEPTETKCGRNHEGGNAERDLVDEAGKEN